jgi:signal transduction histidine kinase
MITSWVSLLDSSRFMPHGSCYLWEPNLLWLHVIADGLIALSYFSIPILLFYFVSQRHDLPFDWIFILFAAFIISCGTNHLLEVWTLWHPDYWVSGFAKLVTALVSAYTATQLVYLMPKVLALPSPAQLEAANQALEAQIKERMVIEKELRAYKDNLEEIVAQRTTDLATANQQMQQEVQERERYEQRLEQTLGRVETINQELNSFAYIVSHDLKAPLRGIKSLAGWLLEDCYDDLNEEGRNLLDLLKNRVQKMHDLIDGILEYSRVGRVEEEKKAVDLQVIVRETIDLLTPPKQIKIEIETKLPVVVGQRTRLQQLFQNLLSNAIKFTDKPEGKIEIGCDEKEQEWQFWVKDNGIGIKPEFQERVFQIFQKLAAEDNESTGIGLALVKKIIGLHQGQVWIESEIGQGSTFFFTLPKVDDTVISTV